MKGSVFEEDIEQIAASKEILWNKMKNTVVLVTGATGLIGNALVHTLSSVSVKQGLNLRIIAHGRDPAKGEVLMQACGVEFIGSDIRKSFPVSIVADRVDYIFHCAAVTRSADMVSRPVDVIGTAIDGTRNVLELAREMQSRSVVYLSSMEVYGQTPLIEVAESDLGYLDLANPRSCYPESKRLCECLCVGYYKQYSLSVKTARLAQTFGAGTPMGDSRVFAQFARSAIAGEDIVLHTVGSSRGNYCYTADVVRALLLLLLDGEGGQAYNIANPDASVTILEMAGLVADRICGKRVSVIVDIPQNIEQRGYAADVGYRLNTDKMQALGWQARYALEDMYERMLADWKIKDKYAKDSAKENT